MAAAACRNVDQAQQGMGFGHRRLPGGRRRTDVECGGVGTTQTAGMQLANLQMRRLTEHKAGWFDDAWEIVRGLAAHRKDDLELAIRLQTVLVGLDARPRKVFLFPGSSVAFDPAGKRLLLGGMSDEGSQKAAEATIWDSGTDESNLSGQTGRGPVALPPTGTPLQFVVDSKDSLSFLLWDVAKRQLVHDSRCRPKPSWKSGLRSTARPWPCQPTGPTWRFRQSQRKGKIFCSSGKHVRGNSYTFSANWPAHSPFPRTTRSWPAAPRTVESRLGH